jgi:hypothetical protein
VLGGAANSSARALAFAPNGDLLIGGDFSHVNGSYTGNVARWDGAVWSAFGNMYNQWGQGIASLSTSTTGVVYAGTSPVYYNYGYVFRSDGSNWSNLGIVSSYYANTEVLVAALPNGDVAVGVYGSPNYGYLSRYSPLNGWQNFNINGPVRALTTFGLDELHIGGSFSGTPNGSAYNVARYVVPCPAQNQPAAPGCAGPSGPTTLTFDPAPWIGLTCQSRTTGLATNSFAFVTFGFSAVNLPLDSVSPLGVSNCLLVPNPDVFLVLAPFAGEVYVPVTIPNSASFAGMVLHHQTVQYELDAAFTPVSLNASNAVRLVVGVY